MTMERPPKGGANPRAPKRKHGQGWVRQRARNGKTWAQRKAESRRYCPPTTVRA